MQCSPANEPLWKSTVAAPAQFRYLNGQAKKYLARGEPVLSIDAKKKERVGNFKNSGQTWRPKGEPLQVNVYDYPPLGEGPAIPYGAYDVSRNQGFVNVGMSHETAEFAVESLRRWWKPRIRTCASRCRLSHRGAPF